mmetsp:Transcript_102241/g.125061  ORF Transcript_102241/g.125061 Transcript_102241/m.125061 type:complete len:282 (+) Transcript_102241:82-927(+)
MAKRRGGRGRGLRMTNKQLVQSELRQDVSRVVDYLRHNRGAQSSTTIKNILNIDINDKIDILNSLKKNDRVLVYGNTFTYQPKIKNINNKTDLCRYLECHPKGTKEDDIKDAYVNCYLDIKSMQDIKRIITLTNNETKTNVLYWFPGLLEVKSDEKNDEIKEFKKNSKFFDHENELRIKKLIEIENKNNKEFPVIDPRMRATWNDILMNMSKPSLETELKNKNLLIDNLLKTRKRKINNNNQKRKKRPKFNPKTSKITNKHLIEDETTKQELIMHEQNRKR